MKSKIDADGVEMKTGAGIKVSMSDDAIRVRKSKYNLHKYAIAIDGPQFAFPGGIRSVTTVWRVTWRR